MKFLLVVAAAIALIPERAEACAMKHNEIAIVLGVAEREVVTVRLDLREGETDGDMTKTAWTGSARFEVGANSSVPLGSIDPKADASKEIDRLIALARAEAKKLPKFVAAKRTSERDCPGRGKCGDVALASKGTELRVGAVRQPLAITLPDREPEDLGITGVVRYQAGKAKIAVVNLGGGDPKFATSVRTCDGGRCRDITTLHHGEQVDVVVVTAGL